MVLMLAATASPADAHRRRSSDIEVMSQNLYIGVDLSRLLTGDSPAALLATMEASEVPDRLAQAARAIDDVNPDLVGLQEVTQITLVDPSGAVLQQIDFLDILLGALSARGESYAVASLSENADVTLPVDASGTTARVLDRDVIIYRTATTQVSNPRSGHYDVNLQVDLGVPVTFTRGWTSVDATVRRTSFRFVNTHLEVDNIPCAGPDGAVMCQDAQAAQLRDLLTAGTGPTVLVGDLNAVPGTTAYRTITDAGYRDTWTMSRHWSGDDGATCCQAEDLLNPTSMLTQRIDHIFVSGLRLDRVSTTVVGDEADRRTPGGRWYSDHGAPVARLAVDR
ncbi:MAG: endonuclease/exonuclease/phosphatase family protein [Acidimicrobiales bacterium]